MTFKMSVFLNVTRMVIMCVDVLHVTGIRATVKQFWGVLNIYIYIYIYIYISENAIESFHVSNQFIMINYN